MREIVFVLLKQCKFIIAFLCAFTYQSAASAFERGYHSEVVEARDPVTIRGLSDEKILDQASNFISFCNTGNNFSDVSASSSGTTIVLEYKFSGDLTRFSFDVLDIAEVVSISHAGNGAIRFVCAVPGCIRREVVFGEQKNDRRNSASFNACPPAEKALLGTSINYIIQRKRG